jgi:formylglycine-generating enzyme required for sulfatase activity
MPILWRNVVPITIPGLLCRGILLAVAALVPAVHTAADDAADLTAWTETFDTEETLDRHWSYYGYLPEGGVTTTREQRPRYWEVVNQELRGNNQPNLHGSGIVRKAAGTDVRLALRFKLPPNGTSSVDLRGYHPLLEKNFFVVGLHIRPTGISAIDNTTLHPKDSPEAAKLKAAGGWNRRFISNAKVAPLAISEDAWHELVMEVRGREQRVLLDGREVLTYTTLAGDAPKTGVGLGLDSQAKTVVHGYFDDVTFGPLEPAPAKPAAPAQPDAAAAQGLDIEWVTVGDPGNPPDATTGRGAVAGVFQISKHEVTHGQYAAFLSAVAATDPHGLWNSGQWIDRTGEAGSFKYAPREAHKQTPVVNVSFLDAMRFANWLHHTLAGGAAAAPAAITETGAYDLAAGGGLAARSPQAVAWIPDENEWYKAAYHQPHAAGGPAGHYWRYPTKSDAKPAPGKAGDTPPNQANYMVNELDVRGPMPVGSFPNAASHYGTLDQGGNAWEWVETTVFDTQRMMRGGSTFGSHEKMLAPSRSSAGPAKRYHDVGFRVARVVPPPVQPAP